MEVNDNFKAQHKATMPIVSLHQENFLVFIDFVNASAVGIMI